MFYAIKTIIKEARESTLRSTSALEEVLNQELLNELKLIEAMLANQETFESNLKNRCIQRLQDVENSLSMHYLPNSPANKLYWDFVNVVFNPQNMQQMLNIILPNIQHQVTVRDTSKNPLKLVKSKLDLSMIKVNFDNLSPYIITTDAIIEKQSVDVLRFYQLIKADAELKVKFPDIYHSIIAEANFCDLLKGAAVKPVTPVTPRQALQQLHFHYKKGTTAVTQNSDAPDSTLLAIVAFSEFMDKLSDRTQTEFRNISDGKTTLGLLFDNDIYKGECSVHVAQAIAALLNNNPAPHDLLDRKVVPHAAPLEASLQVHTCEIPNSFVNQFLPIPDGSHAILIADALSKIPAAFYRSYIRCHRNVNFNKAFDYINYGIFNPDQLQAFVAALISHNTEYSQYYMVVKWLAKLNSPSLFKVIISQSTNSQLMTFATDFNSDEAFTILMNSLTEENRLLLMCDSRFKHQWHIMIAHLSNPKLFIQRLFKHSPKLDDFKQSLLTILNIGVKSHPDIAVALAKAVVKVMGKHNQFEHPQDDWLMYIEDPMVLEAIVGKLSSARVKAFFLQPDNRDNHIFHISNSAALIRTFLDRVPQEERELMMTARNSSGYCPLGRRSLNDAAFKQLVTRGLPKPKRFAVITQCDVGSESLLHGHANHAGRLSVLLESLSHDMRLEAVLSCSWTYIESSTTSIQIASNAVYRAATSKDTNALVALLANLEPHERLTALLGDGKYQSYECALMPLANSVAHLTVALNSLPKTDIEQLLMQGIHNSTLLYYVLDMHSLNKNDAKAFIECLCKRSSEHVLTYLFTGNEYAALIKLTAVLPKLAATIVTHLSAAIRKEAIKAVLGTCLTHKDVTPLILMIKSLGQADQVEMTLHALEKTTSYSTSKLQLPLLKMFPSDQHLLTALQTPMQNRYKKERSLLDTYYLNGLSLKVPMSQLSQDSRPALLHAKLSSGASIIEAQFSDRSTSEFVSEVSCWISLLNDDQACELLHINVGRERLFDLYLKKFMQVIVVNRYEIEIIREEVYQKQKTPSFMQRLLLIAIHLQKTDKFARDKMCFWGMFQSTEASDLLGKIRQCKTVDELKVTLLAEVEKHFSSFRNFILNVMCEYGTVDQRISELKAKWKINAVSELRR